MPVSRKLVDILGREDSILPTPQPLPEAHMAQARDPNDRVQIRRTPEFDAMVADLAGRWGGVVKALSVSEVVREAVRRCHGAEFPRPEKKPSKKGR